MCGEFVPTTISLDFLFVPPTKIDFDVGCVEKFGESTLVIATSLCPVNVCAEPITESFPANNTLVLFPMNDLVHTGFFIVL